jgi:hypothetical protein
LNANAAASTNYNASATGVQTFAVGKGVQSLSFTSSPPSNAVVLGENYTVSGVSSVSSLLPSYSIDATTQSNCAVSGQSVSFLKAGSCLINLNQPGSLDYFAANQVQQSVVIGKGTQTVQFTSVAPAATVGGL